MIDRLQNLSSFLFKPDAPQQCKLHHLTFDPNVHSIAKCRTIASQLSGLS